MRKFRYPRKEKKRRKKLLLSLRTIFFDVENIDKLKVVSYTWGKVFKIVRVNESIIEVQSPNSMHFSPCIIKGKLRIVFKKSMDENTVGSY